MKADVSQERSSFAKLSWFLSTPSPLNNQNPLSQPEMFCRQSSISIFKAYLITIPHSTARSTSPDMITAFHVWLYGRSIGAEQLRRKKHYQKNHTRLQFSWALGSFSNNRDVKCKSPIQFRRESQPQHLKKWFFLKNRPIHFHINHLASVQLLDQFSCFLFFFFELAS